MHAVKGHAIVMTLVGGEPGEKANAAPSMQELKPHLRSFLLCCDVM